MWTCWYVHDPLVLSARSPWQHLPTASPSASNANRSTLIPGRPSGVSDAGISASMPASTLHPITEVANPVIDCAAVCAHAGDCAVMTTREPRMPKASANVSTIRTPRICSSAPDSVVIPNGSLRRESLVNSQRPTSNSQSCDEFLGSWELGIGSLRYGAVQAQFFASLRSPVPLYFAYCGYGQSGRARPER